MGEKHNNYRKREEKILKRLMTSLVMNMDFTNSSVDGKITQILILSSASKETTLWSGREKGICGNKGDTVGNLCKDHSTRP